MLATVFVVSLVALAIATFLLSLPREVREAWVVALQVAAAMFLGLLTAVYVRLTAQIAMQPRLVARLQAVEQALRHTVRAREALQRGSIHLRLASSDPEAFVDPSAVESLRETLEGVRDELNLLQSSLPRSVQMHALHGSVGLLGVNLPLMSVEWAMRPFAGRSGASVWSEVARAYDAHSEGLGVTWVQVTSEQHWKQCLDALDRLRDALRDYLEDETAAA